MLNKNTRWQATENAAVALMVSLVSLGVTAQARAQKAPLTAQAPIALPGAKAGFDWMTMDVPLRRLLVAHRTEGLVVLDLKTQKLLPATKSVGDVLGAALDEKNDQYFLGTSGEQKVVVLDRKTLQVKKEIALDGPVDDITIDPKNGKVYADHDDGKNVWVIDAKTATLSGDVAISGPPEYLEYDPVSDRLFQNVKTDDTVQKINPATNKVEAVWKTTPATSPHGLAVDGKNHRLYAAGKNGILAVLDSQTGKVLTTFPIGKGVDQIALDTKRSRLYCACSGVVSVISVPAKLADAKALTDVPAPKGAHTLTVDEATGDVWTSYSTTDASFLMRYAFAP